MRKTTLVLVLSLAVALPALHADIGENFVKGGIGLSGSVSFYNNFYYFLDDTDERSYWSLEVAPEFEYFLADRVSLWFSPWFSYESMKYDTANIDKSLGFGLSVGGRRAWVPHPEAQKGLVFILGGSLGLSFYPGVDDLVAGVETPDSSMTVVVLTIMPRLYFFLNDRLAPFVGVTPRLGYIVSYKDSAGMKIDLTSRESVNGSLTVTLGVGWFIPNAKASVFLTERHN